MRETALKMLKRKKPPSEVVKVSKLGEEKIRDLASKHGIPLGGEDSGRYGMNATNAKGPSA